MIETEKVIEAMNTIHEYCKEKDKCSGCIFHNGSEECYLTKVVAPIDWNKEELPIID